MLNCKDCVRVPYNSIWQSIKKLERLGFVHMVAQAGMERCCVDHRRSKGFDRFVHRKRGKVRLDG